MPVIKIQLGRTGSRLLQLRTQLIGKYPSPSKSPQNIFPTGIWALDRMGGLQKGEIAEIVGTTGSANLFMQVILDQLGRENCFAALVDSHYSFTPENEAILKRLLWVVCDNAKQALKAAQILVQEAKMPVVLLDLMLANSKELRAITAADWRRLQNFIRKNDIVFIVLCRNSVVANASRKITLKNHCRLKSMQQWRADLVNNLEITVETEPQPATISQL